MFLFKKLLSTSLLLSLIASFIASANAQVSDFELPDFGDSSASVISPIQEKRLGKKLMAQARGMFSYVTDPEIDAYIHHLGSRLLSYSDMAGEDFSFYLIDDTNINAFAIPGGYISLNTGLIANTENESELAGVVAHEITHVTQRHLPRMIARSKNLTLPAAAAVIGGILLGGQIGAAAIIGSNAGLIDDQLSYSRDFEREADSLGMRTLANAGYSPQGMPSFFNTLQRKTRLTNSSAPEFLRTHPLTINRISEAQSRARQYAPKTIESSADYYYMREKIRALASNDRPDKTALEFKSRINKSDQSLKKYIEYGYAYALMENKQYKQALKVASLLLSAEPRNPYLNNLLAQVEAASGDFNAAIKQLELATQQHPSNTTLKIDYADILLKAGQAKKSEQLLRKLIQDNKQYAFLYRLYAQANGETGNVYESHRALAEYQYLHGNYKRALDHLHQAKNNAGDSIYNQASVEARIKELQDEKMLFEESDF